MGGRRERGFDEIVMASRPAKEAAARLLGERRRNDFYRLSYQVSAIASFGALGLYAARLPDRTLYQAPGPITALMRLGQSFALWQMVSGVKQLGFHRFSSLHRFVAWQRDEVAGAEEQNAGPGADEEGRLREAYGDAYAAYEASGTPFLIPWR